MTFLLGVLLIIVPLCIGSGIKILYGKGQSSLCLVYVSGSLAVFLFSGLCQFVAIMGKYSFLWYKNVFMIGVLVIAVLGVVIGVITGKKENGAKEDYHNLLVPAAVLLAAGIFLILFSGVDRTTDFTLETVQTTLSTDSIYEFNSFTGMQIEEGMPIRQKILTPAFLYAAISDCFHVPAQRVVYLYMPIWLLLNVICVVILWSKTLFAEENRQKVFCWFATALMICGGYGMEAAGYQMWSRGYTGNAWVAAVVVPMVVYACLKRKIMLLLLGLAAEVFLAWTTYGIGFGAVTAVVCLAVILWQWIVKRLGKDKKCI